MHELRQHQRLQLEKQLEFEFVVLVFVVLGYSRPRLCSKQTEQSI